MTLIVVQIASFVAISYMEERLRSVTIVTFFIVQIESFVAVSYMEERWRSITIVTLIVVQIASFVAMPYMEERWSVTIVTLIVIQIASFVAISYMENTKELMHCHCGTNNRSPRWTFTNPFKPEVRPSALEESTSAALLAAPAMNAPDTTKVPALGPR